MSSLAPDPTPTQVPSDQSRRNGWHSLDAKDIRELLPLLFVMSCVLATWIYILSTGMTNRPAPLP